MGAVAAGIWSGSRHIRSAALVILALWLGALASWFLADVFGISNSGIWRYAIMNTMGLIYFAVRWRANNAQHRAFHMLLTGAYLFMTSFYVYQLWVSYYVPDAIGVSKWWYQLFANIVFEGVLLTIIAYGVAFRLRRKRPDAFGRVKSKLSADRKTKPASRAGPNGR